LLSNSDGGKRRSLFLALPITVLAAEEKNRFRHEQFCLLESAWSFERGQYIFPCTEGL
jgi:hypothetical protein